MARADRPQLLWKSYIDFETEIGQYERARELYKRLLQRTQHVKVWISYAQFEAGLESEEAIAEARAVYASADKELRKSDDKSERLLLLESWLQFEQKHGAAADIKAIQGKMPKKVKKKREITREDGTNEGWEEYFDYIYPDEQAAQPLKVQPCRARLAAHSAQIMEKAYEWKMKMQQMQQMQQQQEQEQADDDVEAAEQ